MCWSMLASLLIGATATWAPAAYAQPAEEPAPEVPAGPPAMTDAERGQLFVSYATALGSGDRAEAAGVLTGILDDPSKQSAHGQAYGLLADLYEGWDLKLAAVSAWSQAIALDPQAHVDKIAQALDTAEAARADADLAEVLGNNVGLPVTGEAKNRMAYIAGRYHLREGNLGTALAVLMLGDRSAKGFEDVELLRGVVMSQQERYGDSLAPMVSAQALGLQNERGERFDNVVNLNVARSYYADENFGQAILWYAKVQRTSEFWLDAQFERGWAHFRGNDMNGVIALLMNHESPFFEDFFYPEAHLLRAYGLFMMCKFPDASKEMDGFVERYTPIKAEVDGLVGSMSPVEAYGDVKAFLDGSPAKLPVYLLRDFRYEDRINDAIAAIALADDEIERANQVPGRAGELARTWTTKRRDRLKATEGQRVLDRVQSAKGELEEMLTGIEMTRLDLLSLEAKMYERAAATGSLDFGDRSAKLRDLKKRKKGFRVWPYQDEYWADELGWYIVDSRPDCPDALATGDKQ